MLRHKGDPRHCFKCNTDEKVSDDAFDRAFPSLRGSDDKFSLLFQITEIDKTGVFSCQGLCRRQYVNVVLKGGGGWYGCGPGVHVVEAAKANADCSGSSGSSSSSTASPIAAAGAANCALGRTSLRLSELPPKPMWFDFMIGYFCRTVFLGDDLGRAYECVVQSVHTTDEGRKYAVVKFLGYGEEQNCWMDELTPTAGKAAREKQIQEAARLPPVPEEEEEKPSSATEDVVGPSVASFSESSFRLEPHNWMEGDPCRVVYREDYRNKSYEGVVVGLECDQESGRRIAKVRIVGFEVTTESFTEDLTESAGSEAIEKQKAVAAEPGFNE